LTSSISDVSKALRMIAVVKWAVYPTGGKKIFCKYHNYALKIVSLAMLIKH